MIQLKSKKPVNIVPPQYPRGFEKQLEALLVGITKEASKQFFNGTIKKLNVGTVNKFSDAQVGNWAAIYSKLDARTRRAIKKRFNKERISAEVERILKSVDNANQAALYSSIEKKMGVNMQALISQEGLSPQINALIIETQAWVNKNLDDNLTYFANNSLRMMSEGADYDELIEGFDAETDKQVEKSRFIARNQLASFNGLSNKIRYQKLGIKEATWITANDERVRPSHADRDGKTYDLKKGSYSSKDGKWLYPGTDYLCRCVSRPIVPDE